MSPASFLGLFAVLKLVRPTILLYALVALALLAFFWPSNTTSATPTTPTSTTSLTTPHPLDFVQKFDPERFSQIQQKQRDFQRLYKYILGERRPCDMGIRDLHKIRNEALELMESSIFVVPQNFKHIYGRDPDYELEAAMAQYRQETRKQLDTVHRFCNAKHPEIPYRSEVITPPPPYK